MLLLSLCRFEWQLHSRQLSFFIVVSGLFITGLLFGFNQHNTAEILSTGHYSVTKTILMLALATPFVIAVYAGNAINRDNNCQIEELIFGTSITKFSFLFSRWFGLNALTMLSFLLGAVGIIIGLSLMPVTPENNQPFLETLHAAMLALVIFVLPAILLLSSLFFIIGLMTNKNIALYVFSSMLFFGYMTLASSTGNPILSDTFVDKNIHDIFLYFDIYGATPFFEQVKGWSIEQRNFQSFELINTLLINRVIILLFAVLLAVICYQSFQMQLVDEKKNKKVKKAQDTENQANLLVSTSLLTVRPQASFYSHLAIFFALFTSAFSALIKSKVFAVVTLFWLFVLSSELEVGLNNVESLGVTSYATTAAVLWRYQFDYLPYFTTLMLIFFAAEVFWRDNNCQISALVHSTAVSNLNLFIAKLTVLICIPLIFIAITIAVSAITQALYGENIEWTVYLSLFYYVGAPLVCLALLYLFLHSVSVNKTMGVFLSVVLTLIVKTPVGLYLGIEHDLLKFSATPLIQYSDVIGFSASSFAFDSYMKYWLAISAVLIHLGYVLFSRGEYIPISRKFRLMIARPGKYIAVGLSISTLLSAYFAIEISRQTNEVANFQPTADRLLWKADYETQFEKYKDLPRLTVTDIRTEMDFYPKQRQFKLTGHYQLVNLTEQMIDTLLISTDTSVNYRNISMPNAQLTLHDERLGQYIFELQQPIAPGQLSEINFSVEHKQNGFINNRLDNFIVSNFSLVIAKRYMPYIGFNEHLTLKSKTERAAHNLAPLAEVLSLEEKIAQRKGDFSDQVEKVNFETVVSTTASEISFSQGELQRQWQENGRNYYHYQTSDPIRNLVSYVSGKFEVLTKQVDGVDIGVYYAAKQSKNAEHMLSAMEDTINYGSLHFARYPSKQLKLLEVPRNLQSGFTGFALPQLLLIAENVGFHADISNNSAFDHVYRRTVHETSHQWWGHELNVAEVEGASALIETLAKYTEIVLLEEKYGQQYVEQLIEYEKRRYLSGKENNTSIELPLYRSDEAYVVYSKGAIAMYALKNALGAEVINNALRRLLNEHGGVKPAATTIDFINILKLVSPAKYHHLINSWFLEIPTEIDKVTTEL